MTQEEKQLLLKELCARQFYRTKVLGPWEKDGPCELSAIDLTSSRQIRIFEDWFKVEEVRPYLRPMESMTLEEHGQYMDFILWSYNDYDAQSTTCVDKERINEYKEFIYSHHLDDGGLIGKGLALEAPEDMYKME